MNRTRTRTLGHLTSIHQSFEHDQMISNRSFYLSVFLLFPQLSMLIIAFLTESWLTWLCPIVILGALSAANIIVPIIEHQFEKSYRREIRSKMRRYHPLSV